MIKMKNLWSLLTIMMAALVSISLTACGGDDDDDHGGSNNGGGGTSSGIYGYYTRQDWNGFLDLYDDTHTYQFNSQGEIIAVYNGNVSWMDYNISNLGDKEVYYIPDDETFIKYTGAYYKEGASAAAGKELLYRLNYSGLGTLGLYAESKRYFTYWRDGNKLYTTEDGWTVYTVTSTGIIPDGGSFVYSKYDPNTVY